MIELIARACWNSFLINLLLEVIWRLLDAVRLEFFEGTDLIAAPRCRVF